MCLRLLKTRSSLVTAMTLALFASPAAANEPTLDELLGVEEPEQPDEQVEPGDAPDAPDEQDVQLDEDALDMDELEEDLRRRLSRDELASAFEAAVEDMGEVAIELNERGNPGVRTQREQQRIIARLDQVLESAGESDGGGGGGGGADQDDARLQDHGAPEVADQQSQAGAERDGSGDTGGDGEHDGSFSPGEDAQRVADERDIEELREEWGQLPPRLRDEISEGLEEQFSPVYRSLTEQYYRRLAEPDEPER